MRQRAKLRMFLLGLLLSFGISFEKANCAFTGVAMQLETKSVNLNGSLFLLPPVGNWIITMQRFNGTLDFNRGWIDYRNGFGDIGREEFWLGNEKVHAMTSKPGLVYQLRIEVQTNESWFYADYANFSLDSEDNKYALHVSGFSGNAGDSMTNTTVWSGWFHNGMNFSTPDADNDKATTTDNCAAKYSAGWWYNDCWMSCLTCPYGIDFAWESLIHLPSRGRLGAARMMIKIAAMQSETKSFNLNGSPVLLPTVNNWIIMMQRFDGTLDFNRGWIDYRNGFGDIGRGEFWLGNEKVRAITSQPGLVYQLRIEVQTNESWFYADYANFSLDSEDNKYALHVSGFSGNAGDSLSNTTVWSGWFHNGMNFSTVDADNDKATTTTNCAAKYSAGWWYNDCWMSCLTCPYGIDFAWESLIHLPSRGRLGAARMMIKTVEDKPPQSPTGEPPQSTTVSILLGAVVLTTIIILICLAILLIRIRRQKQRNTERGSEYEFPQRHEESNLPEAGLGNYIEVVESEYDKPDDIRRRLPSVQDVYEELKKHANGHEILQTGESSLQEAGLGNVVFVDDAGYDYPD